MSALCACLPSPLAPHRMGSGSREAFEGFQRDSWEIKSDANSKLGIRAEEDGPHGNGAAAFRSSMFFFFRFLGHLLQDGWWWLVQLQVQQQRWDNWAGLARDQTPPSPAPAAHSVSKVHPQLGSCETFLLLRGVGKRAAAHLLSWSNQSSSLKWQRS